MGKRQEIAKKGAIVRYLIDENKYIEALEVIDELDLNEVESTADLNLFADLYEKAERFDKKKEIYYIIYKRNHSRYVLNRLLRLVLRMGDMEEARELFLTYEMAGSVTLDTYELRYLLARAEGASRKVLIDILEELKKEEYTEEWGYQLARLYEQEGLREQCIAECKDLILWFGTGKTVEKAKELLARCEQPDWQPPQEEDIPEPESEDEPEILPYASGPVKVKELSNDEDEYDDEDEDDEEPEELPLVDEFVSEVEESEDLNDSEADEEEADEETEVDDEESEEETEVDDEESAEETENDDEEVEEENEEAAEESAEEPKEKKSAFQRFKNFFRGDDVFEPEQPTPVVEPEVPMTEEEIPSVEAEIPAADVETDVPKADFDEDEFSASLEAKVTAMEEALEKEQEKEPEQLEVEEAMPRVQMEVETPTMTETKEEQLEVEEPIEVADISDKGISYHTLKDTMRHLNRHTGPAHFAFAGGEERITLAVAKRMTKELNKIGYFSAGSINRISAEVLNQIELMDQTDKLLGGCTLITSAPELTKKSVNDLITCMNRFQEKIVIMISGPFDEMDCFLASYPELAELFDFKVRM